MALEFGDPLFKGLDKLLGPFRYLACMSLAHLPPEIRVLPVIE